MHYVGSLHTPVEHIPSAPPFSVGRDPRRVIEISHLPSARTARFSLKKRPNENSEQFKQCFFRFLRFLLRDLVKRKHRSIIKERWNQASRQAAEKSSKSKAQANAVAGASTGGGGGSDFEADDRLRRQAPPRPPASSSSANSRPSASLPAAVRG